MIIFAHLEPVAILLKIGYISIFSMGMGMATLTLELIQGSQDAIVIKIEDQANAVHSFVAFDAEDGGHAMQGGTLSLPIDHGNFRVIFQAKQFVAGGSPVIPVSFTQGGQALVITGKNNPYDSSSLLRDQKMHFMDIMRLILKT
tara:strand:- start:854 stop:1285 length:432 start_codon:yes stop_codon:yes gene_type:complete